MIQDLDDTLAAMLVQNAGIDTRDIDIKFEMPTREWSAAVSRPTVNIYLYDLRENLELRSNDTYLTRDGDNGTLLRAPVRMDLCYLISVWLKEIADEHRLLGNILAALVRFPVLPAEVLRGSMQTQPLPLQAWIAQPERTPKPWDFWGHVEHRLKASLSYCVTLAIDPQAPQTVALVRNRDLTVQIISPDHSDAH